jgi:hypothetical protein
MSGATLRCAAWVTQAGLLHLEILLLLAQPLAHHLEGLGEGHSTFPGSASVSSAPHLCPNFHRSKLLNARDSDEFEADEPENYAAFRSQE